MSIDQLMYARRGFINPTLFDLRKQKSPDYRAHLKRVICSLRDSLEVHPDVGRYFVEKYRKRAAESGHHVAATQLRKQGVPLPVTLRTLFGVVERFRWLHKDA